MLQTRVLFALSLAVCASGASSDCSSASARAVAAADALQSTFFNRSSGR
jgi:hypothetical protein